MSPGTTSSAGISPYCPSRQTNAVGSASLRSAAMAFSARYSLKTSTSHRQYSSLGIGVNPEFRAHARHDAVAHGIESSAFGPSTVNRSPGTGRGRNRGRMESIAGGREPRNELLLKHQELVILPKLITLIRDSSNGTENRSVTRGQRTATGVDRICSWISGARRSIPMTYVTRARVMPSRMAMSAWLAILPDSRRACHSMALRRSSTTRGVLATFGGFGVPRWSGAALTTLSAASQRVRAPTLLFSKAPLGPRAISTVCSR